jgi:hypothetical protein
LLQQLSLSNGDIVTIENIVLKKGSFVKIQPRKEAFIKISDPKAVYINFKI